MRITQIQFAISFCIQSKARGATIYKSISTSEEPLDSPLLIDTNFPEAGTCAQTWHSLHILAKDNIKTEISKGIRDGTHSANGNQETSTSVHPDGSDRNCEPLNNVELEVAPQILMINISLPEGAPLRDPS